MNYFSIFSRVTIHVCIYIYWSWNKRICFFNGFPCSWVSWNVHILSTPGKLRVYLTYMYLKSNVCCTRQECSVGGLVARLGVMVWHAAWWLVTQAMDDFEQSTENLLVKWLRGYGDVCFLKGHLDFSCKHGKHGDNTMVKWCTMRITTTTPRSNVPAMKGSWPSHQAASSRIIKHGCKIHDRWCSLL